MKGMYVLFICWGLIIQPAFAVPEGVPSDVIKAQRDGYLYADYPGVFDDAEGKGITVEAWIYLTDKPKDWNSAANSREGRWIIFVKPGSYFVTINGRDLSFDIDPIEPEGTAYVNFGVQALVDGGMGAGISGRVIPPHDFPLQRWVHIVYQIFVKGNRTKVIWYYDGDWGGFTFSSAMSRTDAPLLIGGTNRNASWGWTSRHGSMKGYIDEFRVSKGFRYDEVRGRKIRPKRRLRADRRTIALWRFEEGPGATRYADSSGNGYTLRAGGSLAVEPRGKLVTTWGSLKRRAHDAE